MVHSSSPFVPLTMHPLAITSLVTLLATLQFLSWLPFVRSVDPQSLPDGTQVLNSVAIIGAGAAGSSAAFWMGKANERNGLGIKIDVYEQMDRIGGSKYAAILFDHFERYKSRFEDLWWRWADIILWFHRIELYIILHVVLHCVFFSLHTTD